MTPRCYCGGRLTRLTVSIETYSAANPPPPTDEVPMHVEVWCEWCYVRLAEPAQLSLLDEVTG